MLPAKNYKHVINFVEVVVQNILFLPWVPEKWRFQLASYLHQY